MVSIVLALSFMGALGGSTCTFTTIDNWYNPGTYQPTQPSQRLMYDENQFIYDSPQTYIGREHIESIDNFENSDYDNAQWYINKVVDIENEGFEFKYDLNTNYPGLDHTITGNQLKQFKGRMVVVQDDDNGVTTDNVYFQYGIYGGRVCPNATLNFTFINYSVTDFEPQGIQNQ